MIRNPTLWFMNPDFWFIISERESTSWIRWVYWAIGEILVWFRNIYRWSALFLRSFKIGVKSEEPLMPNFDRPGTSHEDWTMETGCKSSASIASPNFCQIVIVKPTKKSFPHMSRYWIGKVVLFICLLLVSSFAPQRQGLKLSRCDMRYPYGSTFWAFFFLLGGIFSGRIHRDP